MSDKAAVYQSSAIEFHKLEYEALHREIEASTQELLTLERYALIGSGAVWTWLATTKLVPKPPEIVWWIPVLFSLLGILRTWALLKSIARTSSYLQLLESVVYDQEILGGWETFIHKPENRKQYLRKFTWIFWGVLLIATIVIPLVVR
jgi:hypothetical protein